MVKYLNKKGTAYIYFLDKEDSLYFKQALYEKGLTLDNFCFLHNIKSRTNLMNVLGGRIAIGMKLLKEINDFLKEQGKEELRAD